MSKGRSRAIKLAVLHRDQYKCRMCETPHNHHNVLTNHHIIPLSWKNGTDTVENGITLCRTCHDFIEVMYDKGIVFPHTCVDFIEFQLSVRRSENAN